MLGKVFIAAVGGAVGYVLGAKAGRERYEQLKEQASRIRHDPRVQQRASQAGDAVKDGASQAAETVKDGAARAKDKLAESDKVPGGKDPDEPDGSMP